MAVSLDPESIQVAAAGGEITLQLKNSSAEVCIILFSLGLLMQCNRYQFLQGRYAFKVKCTDNDHYRVNPVFGFVDPAGNAAVLVRRTVGEGNQSYKINFCFFRKALRKLMVVWKFTSFLLQQMLLMQRRCFLPEVRRSSN